MKLAELLNVDTTKENWFKLLSKKGINPKTVSAVSKGGGGGGGVKEYYYRLNTEHEQYEYAVEIMMFLMIKEFIFNEINIHRFYGKANLSELLFAKVIKGICIFDCSGNSLMAQEDNDNGTITQIIPIPKGNIKEKISQIVPELESMIDEIFIPITKEEYESLITQ